MNSFPLSALIKGQLLSLTSALCFILLESWINSRVFVKRSFLFVFFFLLIASEGEKKKDEGEKKKKHAERGCVCECWEWQRENCTSPPFSCPSSLESEADIYLQLSRSQLKQIHTHATQLLRNRTHGWNWQSFVSLVAASFLHFFLLILKGRFTIFQIVRCAYEHWNRLTAEAWY